MVLLFILTALSVLVASNTFYKIGTYEGEKLAFSHYRETESEK